MVTVFLDVKDCCKFLQTNAIFFKGAIRLLFQFENGVATLTPENQAPRIFSKGRIR